MRPDCSGRVLYMKDRMKSSGITGLLLLAVCTVPAGTFAGLAVDFDAAQILTGIQYEYVDFPLDPDGAPQAALPDYTGQPIYAGLFLDPVNGWTTGVDDGGAYTNGAAISFGSNGGAKLQLNGPWLGSETSTTPGLDDGRYAPGDEFTGIFGFKQEDFLNGHDMGTVSMTTGADALSADLVYQPKGILASGAFRWVVLDNGAFYISDVVTNFTSTVNVSVTVQDNALSLSWYQYDPIGDGTVATVSTIGSIGAPAAPALQDIEAFGFWLQAVVATNTGFRTYPRIGVEGYQATVLSTAGSGECIIDAAVQHQTMEGFGASGAFFQNRLITHNQSNELAELLFDDLGLDIFRIRNVYLQDEQPGWENDVQTFRKTIELGEAAAGRPLKILISSWTPPASLKSTGLESGANDATLASDENGYRYDDFAAWWADSLDYYSANGIDADYISIQNEPNWDPDYDGCGFEPSETTNFAGYNLAFEAVWQELASELGTAAMPKMIGPEPIGIRRLDQYIDALIDQDHMYGFAHHLYQFNPAQNPDALNAEMAATQAAYGYKPLFQTEYAYLDGNTEPLLERKLDMAKLMYNALTIEEVSAYFYWALYWTTANEQGLINIPSNAGSPYTINTEYYAFKHYSAFIHSDWTRVDVDPGTNALSICAFVSPDRDAMTVVVVNEGTASVNLTLALSNVTATAGSVYQTTGVLDCALVGAYTPGSPVLIPAESITTLSLGTRPPAALWNEWIAGFSLGSATNYLDDPEPDLRDNLTEYAWGGDPSVANDPLINTPLLTRGSDGGSNVIEYIYFERSDAFERGLNSMLTTGTDLVNTNWVDAGSYEVGRGAAPGAPGYHAVTNRIPTDAEEQQFIRLQIEYTP